MHYFARTTAGLEEIVWLDMLDWLGQANLKFLGHRVIHFDYAGHPTQLLELRSVDDIYVYAGHVDEIDHRRSALQRLRAEIGRLSLDSALGAVRSVRSVGKPVSFYVTASYLGSRNYSRYEIQDTVAAGIVEQYGWKLVDSSDIADIDVRVLLDESEATIGLRLQAWPLHRRSYKVASVPGSLKPPVAYCLAALAQLKDGHLVLDPFGGAGTIAIESAHLLYEGALIVSDVDEEAVRAAAVNSARANTVLTPHLLRSDARQLPLPDRSVSRVVSNLPWGRQVQVGEGLAALYGELMRELQRVLTPGGRAVLLTDQSELLLQHMGPLELAFARQISLYGAYPTIHVLDYDYAAKQDGAAFAEVSRFGVGINEMIERDGVWQAYSPLVGKVK